MCGGGGGGVAGSAVRRHGIRQVKGIIWLGGSEEGKNSGWGTFKVCTQLCCIGFSGCNVSRSWRCDVPHSAVMVMRP